MALFTIMVFTYRRRNIIEVESYDYLVLPDTEGTRQVGGGKNGPSRTESFTVHHAEVKYVLDSGNNNSARVFDSSNNNSAQAYETLRVEREGSPYSPGSPITVFARKDTKQAYDSISKASPGNGCLFFTYGIGFLAILTGAGLLCAPTSWVNFYSGGKFALEHEYFMHEMSADYDDVSRTWILMFIWCIITFVIVPVGFSYILKKSKCGSNEIFIKALRSNEKIVVRNNPDASVRLPVDATVHSSATPLSFWQYQDGGSWLNFGLGANNQLNELVAKGFKEVKVGIWTIDTNQMEQRNVSTGTNRKVRPPIHWQWHDGEIYRDYDLKTSSMIYDGISNSRTELKGVLIASNNCTLDLNMASMEQINERTKVKRQICHPNMKSDVFATVVETGI